MSPASPDKVIEERKYLKGVTPKALEWYHNSFRAFEGALDSEDQVKQRIVELRSGREGDTRTH